MYIYIHIYVINSLAEKRKWGGITGNVHKCDCVVEISVAACSPLLGTTSSVRASFPIFYGICMGEHTCQTRPSLINENVVRKT